MSEDYEAVPYFSYPIPAAHPRRLAWTSTAFGGPRPDLARARVLEIGCGNGAHLLPIAAFEPEWTAHGIDTSARALEAAREGAARSGLTNVTFTLGDLGGVALEAGAWDFVIAHGVYSWIDAERRDALRALMRRALAPTGLAYLSFNAQPGWGVRGRIRDILMRAPEEDYRTLLDRLAPHCTEHAWGVILAHEIDLARNARPDYMPHEYLADHNDAFWIADFVNDCARDGLSWVGDSQFDLPEGIPYEITKAALGIEGLRGEELTDLLGYRQLRGAVLARDDAPRRPPADDEELLRSTFVSGVILPTREEFDLSAATEETMRSAGGMDILVREPLSKMALRELARIHPDGLRADDLIRRAHEALAVEGVEPGPEEERLLREGLLRLWRSGALALREHRPSIGVALCSHPKAWPLTRYEAATRPVISTPLGVALALDATERERLQELDGTQPCDEPFAATLARWGLFQAG